MRALTLSLIVAIGSIGQASAQTSVYRCGNVYAEAPCPGAVMLALAPSPTAEQVREARAAARQEQQLADTLRRERLREEREAGARSVMSGIAAGARTRLPDAPPKPTPARDGRKSGKKSKLGYFADDPKVTQVIEQAAPKKARR